MHNEIVALALKKIQENEGAHIKTKKAAECLSSLLFDEYGVTYGERSLRNVYNDQIKISKPEVLNALCNFLDFENYEDFLKKHDKEEDQKETNIEGKESKKKIKHVKVKPINKKRLVITALLYITTIIGFSVFSVNEQRWMAWKIDHYEEVNFNLKKYKLEHLEMYDAIKIENFKKIEAICDDIYFNEENEPKIWYRKVSKNKIELFTAPGLHPVNGKTLKPISTYMIDKYICK
ncbi:hypothetical protein SAMN04489761_4355 [Tenacibaculum sp. MAR_2009_124]|uniref:hypothetical protein n=1 Tax=Tenacibaculum sp. MAR_2009_124 TaxID=1250059 RepID=UPI000896D26F|nr:hypothetical protein [Tenacibaculum sp. MAR_2009_124]SED12665.1 hypothetical protein SAMN04489761_4355 [Tenacibaculum sp. MAR_2009_124]